MRLDKYIASVTDYSRAEVKRLLKQHAIEINGVITTSPAQHIDENNDDITLHGNKLSALIPRYFMLNKPKGTVCATEDSEHPTVIDLIDEPNKEKLHIAGRLDKDTTGLVLVTDDGQWNHRITSPKKACFKTYRVTLATPLQPDAIKQLTQGITLRNETLPTRPAKVSTIDTHTIELSIQEGKYHQVKRMLAAVGNHVEDLHRQKIGNIHLDSTLVAGEYRSLHADEIALDHELTA
jgi:16S rRNA pseudouridine516 synthase